MNQQKYKNNLNFTIDIFGHSASGTDSKQVPRRFADEIRTLNNIIGITSGYW